MKTEANIQTTFKVKGNVQKVGYRDKVQEIALEMGITGYTRNLEDRTVEIVCEGEKKDIEKFKKAIFIKKGFIAVKEITTLKTKKANDKFKTFTIKRGSTRDELGERLDTAIIYLDATKEELKDTLGSKIDNVGNKIDNMADRMDTNFDKMGQKYHIIGEEIKATNENLTKLVENFTVLVKDYVETKEKQK